PEAIYKAIEQGELRDVTEFLESWPAKNLEQPIEDSYSPLEYALEKGRSEIAHVIFGKMNEYPGNNENTLEWLTKELKSSLEGKGNPTQVFKLLEKIPLSIIKNLSTDEQQQIVGMLKEQKNELLLKVIVYLSDDCVKATLMPL